MTDYYDILLPSVTISEKYYYGFWKKIGGLALPPKEEITASGYLIPTRNVTKYIEPLNNYARKYRINKRYTGYFFTPLPTTASYRYPNFKKNPGIIAAVESHIKVPNGPVTVTGVVVDFSDINAPNLLPRGSTVLGLDSPVRGRFVVVREVEPVKVTDYFSIEKPGITGGGVERIVDSTFDEDLITPFLLKLVAASMLYDVMPGVTMSFGVSQEEYYGINGAEWKTIKKMIPSYLSNGERIRTTVELMGVDRDIKINVGSKKRRYFPTGYVIDTPAEHTKYVTQVRTNPRVYNRTEIIGKGRYERSNTGIINLKGKLLMALSRADVPYIPVKESAKVVDIGLMSEYIVDVAYFSLWKYLESPVIEPKKYENILEYELLKIKNEYSDVYKFMEIPEKILKKIDPHVPAFTQEERNGFGGHLRRMANAVERMGVSNPEKYLWENIIEPFVGRFYDIYSRAINVILLMAAEHKHRSIRIGKISSLLESLNAVYSNGWSEVSFVKWCILRGIAEDETKAERLLDDLMRGGYVIRIKEDTYKAVAYPEDDYDG